MEALSNITFGESPIGHPRDLLERGSVVGWSRTLILWRGVVCGVRGTG